MPKRWQWDGLGRGGMAQIDWDSGSEGCSLTAPTHLLYTLAWVCVSINETKLSLEVWTLVILHRIYRLPSARLMVVWHLPPFFLSGAVRGVRGDLWRRDWLQPKKHSINVRKTHQTDEGKSRQISLKKTGKTPNGLFVLPCFANGSVLMTHQRARWTSQGQ